MSFFCYVKEIRKKKKKKIDRERKVSLSSFLFFQVAIVQIAISFFLFHCCYYCSKSNRNNNNVNKHATRMDKGFKFKIALWKEKVINLT